MTEPFPTPIPAATLVLYRDREDAPAEHLFVERAATMVFAAGAVVFPGGRVDPDDREIAAQFPELDSVDAAARVAAIRETVEEAGVAVGFSPPLNETEAEGLRKALSDGNLLSKWLIENNRTLELDALTPFARWCPNHRKTRNFDTHFYITRAPENAHIASVDATENVHLFWASADEVLARAASSALSIIFPTKRNLERLASVPAYDQAVAHARAHPVRLISPTIIERDGVKFLTIPADMGYPIYEENIANVRRGGD